MTVADNLQLGNANLGSRNPDLMGRLALRLPPTGTTGDKSEQAASTSQPQPGGTLGLPGGQYYVPGQPPHYGGGGPVQR